MSAPEETMTTTEEPIVEKNDLVADVERRILALQREKGEFRHIYTLAGLQEREPREIVNQFLRAVTEFTRRETFEDDLTLVVVKGT